jgi:Uma2 family endonuclease
MATTDFAVKSAVSGQVVATGISFETYLEKYAADFHEWVRGEVVKIAPIHRWHDAVARYLATLLAAYFELKPLGAIRQAPFVMRLPAAVSSREPDIQVILHANPGSLTDKYMNGPADLCIEVVSLESMARDHGEKFAEYEKGGVREYWIVDSLHDECRFYRLDEAGRYRRHTEDEAGHYRTPQLPGLTLHVPTLWLDSLPGPGATVQAVQAMVREG